MRRVLASAWDAGSRNARPILLASVAVSVLTALVETAAHEFIDRANVPVAVIGDLVLTGVDLLGLVIVSGVLSQVIGQTSHGRRHVSVGQFVRALPWSRLIRADIAVAVLTTAGLLLLIIPGLVALTLLAVVGPVIEIEHRPVLAALRRSTRLVRPHFWAVALLATLPVLVAGELPAALPDQAGLREVLIFLAVRGVAEAAVNAVIGVVLVELAYRLIHLQRGAADPADPAAPGRAAPAAGW